MQAAPARAYAQRAPPPPAAAPITPGVYQAGSQGRISRPLGVTILAVLQILGSLGGIAVGLSFAPLLSALGVGFLGYGIVVSSVLGLLFALALFTGRNWARLLMLVSAVFFVVSIVGIIWGIILIWYFRKSNVVAYFKQPR